MRPARRPQKTALVHTLSTPPPPASGSPETWRWGAGVSPLHPAPPHPQTSTRTPPRSIPPTLFWRRGARHVRSAEEFNGKDVLIIGTSYSAEDIASQCYKYGAKSLTCSWRTAPMGFHWPNNFKTVPLLQKVSGRTCTFKDGTTTDVDVIIMCTGYKHHFPFIEPALRLTTPNVLWIDTLHEGVVWPTNHQLFYIGMQDQWFTFNMFDAQAWYARDIVLKRLSLPDSATMKAEWAKWRAADEGKPATDEACIRFQADYVQRLVDKTDYPNFNIEGVVQLFLEWEHNKHADIMSFRDKPHKSVLTGTEAPVHHTPWLTAFDDSIACYVGK